MTDFRAQLAAAFAGERAEHVAAIRAGLAAVESGGKADLRDLFRRAHSLKGAARAVGEAAVEAGAHALEAILAAVEQRERALDPATIAELRSALDAMEDVGSEEAEGEAPASETLRVGEAHVEQLARSVTILAEEIRARAAVAEGLDGLEAELQAIAALVTGGEAGRRVSRAGAELRRLKRSVGRAQWSLDRALLAVEHDAERIMLLPVRTLMQGFERMVREVAAAQGKQVMLREIGGEGEADRRVLQELRDPVMHLLRNAIGHGIEPPEARARAGKATEGLVTLTVEARGGTLAVCVADDGAGLDYARIAEKARRQGVAIGRGTPAELRAAVFAHRFSTADGVDEISGRGVGLSVVADAARRLHGHAEIHERAEGGTEVSLTVPLALSRQALVLFEAGGAHFALPAGAVRQVMRLGGRALEPAEGGDVTRIEDRMVPVVGLAGLIGLSAGGDGAGFPGLLVQDGDREAVLVVDALSDVKRAMVGDPTAIAADVAHVYGTVILDDGTVALVLSPREMLARAAARQGGTLPGTTERTEARARSVLVVDDSVTTRTLERSILEAQGYRVLLAVDGLDALERLRSGDAIDLVVADIEMPRMDGFALLSAIRNDPALANIPVVMMTSRNAPDDIERGLALGANAYLTKQDFDQGGLVSIVGQLA